jgi:hypothetical protein
MKMKWRKPKKSSGMEGSNESGTGGIIDLTGYYYTYGVPGQKERYLKTTERIAEYVALKYTKELAQLVTDKEEAEFKEPEDPGANATPGQIEVYKMEMKEYREDVKTYKRDKAKVFQLIMAQCNAAMKSKVKGLSEFSDLHEQDDVATLLTRMKELVYSTDSDQYEYWIMQANLRNFLTMKQGEKESLTSFSQRFLEQQEVLEDIWGDLIPTKLKKKDTAEQIRARNKFLACVFLAGTDRKKYKAVIDELNDDFVKGTVAYPSDVPGMIALLSNHRGCGTSDRQRDDLADGVVTTSFAQRKTPFICHCCGKAGHAAYKCEYRKTLPKDKWFNVTGKKYPRDDDSSIGSANMQNDSDDERSNKSSKSTRSRGSKQRPAWYMTD